VQVEGGELLTERRNTLCRLLICTNEPESCTYLLWRRLLQDWRDGIPAIESCKSTEELHAPSLKV
jgi:hypothetical protein